MTLERNAKIARILSALLLVVSLSGCRTSQDTLNGYATFVFFVYLVSLGVAVGINQVHDHPSFQKLRENTMRLSVPLGFLLTISGMLVTIFHTYRWLDESEKDSVPWIFLGVSLAVSGQALISWAKTIDKEKQKLLMKIISLSMAFFLALLFLATGGEGLKQ